MLLRFTHRKGSFAYFNYLPIIEVKWDIKNLLQTSMPTFVRSSVKGLLKISHSVHSPGNIYFVLKPYSLLWLARPNRIHCAAERQETRKDEMEGVSNSWGNRDSEGEENEGVNRSDDQGGLMALTVSIWQIKWHTWQIGGGNQALLPIVTVFSGNEVSNQ